MSSRKKSILLFLSACLVLTGCRSTSSPTVREEEGTPYVPLPEEDEHSIGYFLAQYDKSLRRWTELKLAPASERDARALRALESNLQRRSREREDDLLSALESGPPTNREVAVVALGFTGKAESVSPIVAALSDEDPCVVQKALLGLGILGRPETPLSQVLYILQHSPDPWTRNNAAYALQRVVAAGGNAEDLGERCRDALYDQEPGVRAQIASVLGMLHDPDSVDPLSDLLDDETNLVSAAGATALARIGKVELEKRGPCARALAEGLTRTDGERRRHIIRELKWLSERDLGGDEDAWREWAYRLP